MDKLKRFREIFLFHADICKKLSVSLVVDNADSVSP